ncbi:uncharacterized protein SOCEGT47_005380 [Sorangium cellulosum]|uniref:Uncharacterized protein n=1 Tax=Sorangium cellulosum TaxID=56 RepID=A0A4P2PTM9_SORCE|nr:hypothetical protein [Sorangium cellulosum]AUX20075.1 uncharacterized protein SOCEGT47_005380 [Sorangium cellulosum]
MTRDLRSIRSLVHPLWLGALALLVLNDHALKGSGLLPGWMTGKLSDLAGLLVAPAVLAALLRVSSRRGFLGAHVATGAVFAAIKVAPEAARAVEGVMALTPLPWRITVDPTDLLALPMLLVSYRVLGGAARRPEPAQAPARTPIALRLALMAGSLACVATSYEPVPCDGAEGCVPPAPQELASLVIGNMTDDVQLVRVRRLRDPVRADCGVVLADPTGALSGDLFANAETWLVEPGRALPLENDGCDAYLVDADGLPLTLLAWSAAEFPMRSLVTSTAGAAPETLIALQRAGSRLELAEHPAVFPAPPAEPPPPAGACTVAVEGGRLDWTTPTWATSAIASVTSSPDGCHAITPERGEPFYLCVPAGAMPFRAGDVISVRAIELKGWASYPEVPPGEVASVRGLHVESEAAAVLAVRGNALARWSMASADPRAPDFSADVSPLAGCDGFHDACGSLVAPLEASLLGEGVSGIVSLRPGERAELAEGAGVLHLVRAEDMPVRDAGCFTAPLDQSRSLESVLIAVAAP